MGEDLITEILNLANQTEGTSDIHIKAGIPPYLRINGELRHIETDNLTEENTQQIANSLLSQDQQVKLKQRGDVDSSFKLRKEEKILSRYRVHACKDENGISIDLRLIPDNIMPVEDIGFPYTAVWQNIVQQREGLVLITGRTGQGKTTTNSSLIQRINETRKEHIITIEDPIEYVYHPVKSIISQREVGEHVKSFEDGLIGALRQDPNVILIGEIRSKETAYIALEAAGSGHLVFSTLHTRNAVESVSQYVNFFDKSERDNARNQLAASLNYIISQQLVPDLSGGQIMAMEVMNVQDSNALKTLLRDGKEHQIMTHIQTGQQHGMISMDDCLKNLYNKRKISVEDLYSYAHESNHLTFSN
jgi:twitching motility protein PilT